MACRGVFFALSDNDAQKLLSVDLDDDVVQIIQEDIEERWDEEWLQQTDKAWDAIHRCLTDGTLACNNSSILEKCVLGGKQLYQQDDYIVSFLAPQEVKDVYIAIRSIEKDWFRKKYFHLKKRSWLNQKGYDGPKNEDDFEYTWAYFVEVRCFYEKAAQANRAVVFTVDQ